MSCTEGAVISPSSRIIDPPTVLFLLAVLIFLYSFLFIWPFLPIEIFGDNLFYLASGQRMYEGETIYRDFIEIVTPGTALVHFFLFRIFGLRPWIPNLLALLLGLGLAWVGVVITKKLTRPSLALLPSGIFIVGVYKNHIDPTHHWYSVLAAVSAIAVLMERRTSARIAAAGFLCGLAACFTQTRGIAVLMGFGAYLWWESRLRREDWRGLLKKEVWLVASFLAALFAVNGYFIWKAGPTRYLWCTVVFNLKYYPLAGANRFLVITEGLPTFESLRRLPLLTIEWLFIHTVIPLVYVWFFVRYRRESAQTPAGSWERPMLLAMSGGCMLLSVAPAASHLRLAVCTLPGIILLVWLIDSPRKLPRAVATVLAVGLLAVAPHAVAKAQFVERKVLTLPQGKLAIEDAATYAIYAWVGEHTRPSQYLYEAAWTDIYFYLNLRNPTPSGYVENNGFTPPEQVAEVILGLEKHQVRYVLWFADLDLIANGRNPSEDNLWPLRGFIHSHYHQIKVFADSTEVWERKD